MVQGAPRNKSGPKREEITGGCSGLRKEELHDYRSQQMQLLGVAYRTHATEERKYIYIYYNEPTRCNFGSIVY
jgi:hypothetical protein